MGSTDQKPGGDDRARNDRFLDGVEHDLRNPLNTLGMTIALLGRGNPSPETVARGERAIERLAAMGDQLVAFGRIVMGSGLELRPEGARLDDVVRSVIPGDARVRFTPSDDGQGRWDIELVQRAIRELLNNAIDHGGPGTILVVAGTEGARVFVTVESEAPLSAELTPELAFDPVERSVKARTRPIRGLGLGLYLARAIARAHGGDVALERSDGPTRFRLTLPSADASGKASL
jgi:signal transduction histidine kinase